MDCLIKREFWRVDGRRNGEVLLNGAYDSEYIVVDLKIYNRSTPCAKYRWDRKIIRVMSLEGMPIFSATTIHIDAASMVNQPHRVIGRKYHIANLYKELLT